MEQKIALTGLASQKTVWGSYSNGLFRHRAHGSMIRGIFVHENTIVRGMLVKCVGETEKVRKKPKFFFFFSFFFGMTLLGGRTGC